LNADQALNRPSFRATERAFQLLTNLEPLARERFFLQAGSLRGIERLLQSGPSFYRQELEARKQAAFPPHIRLLRLLFTGSEEESVWKAAQHFRQRLLDAQLPFSLTGPLAAAYPRLQGLWRVELLARFDIGPLPEEIRPLLAFHSPRGGVHLSVELDPED
jgi:primosomal protein N' (replication factor Y)